MKTCKDCGIEKPYTEFNKNKKCADGFLTYCKSCNKILRQNLKTTNPIAYANRLDRSKTHRLKNKTHIKETKRKWDSANIARISTYNKNKYCANPEEARSRTRTYSKNNPEKVAIAHRNWCKNNPTAYRKIKNKAGAKRRAAKLNAVPLWVNDKRIKMIYDKAVERGLLGGVEYHVDHIVPLIHPNVCGLHCEENLQIVTKEYNLKKNNMFII